MTLQVLILTGPTASGKSAVALELAERLGGEVVAADSMTLYRGMDIGTAKPSAADRARVPHHLIDVLDPWESGNVAWWLGRAAAAVADIRRRGKVPVLVGGTPLYLKAVVCGLSAAPPAAPDVRRRLEAEAERDGPAALHARLAAVDPASAARLHPNDTRRVVRALEVWEATGRPLSAHQVSWAAARPPAVPVVALDCPRPELHRRIDRRVDEMLAAGWADEVRRLLKLPQGLSPEAGQAAGYRELADHLAGGGPGWADTVAAVKARTRQLAKRQLTWLRHLPGVRWVTAGPAAADRAAAAWAAQRAEIRPTGGPDTADLCYSNV